MVTIKILRLLQFAGYVVITSQLLFYLLLLNAAMKKLSISNFIELRKIIDIHYAKRLKMAYYVTLAICIVVVILSVNYSGPAVFITSIIALCCLAGDIIISLKGNVPLNNLINLHAPGQEYNWEEVRRKWLAFIQYRGLLIVAGMLSLIIGAIMNER